MNLEVKLEYIAYFYISVNFCKYHVLLNLTVVETFSNILEGVLLSKTKDDALEYFFDSIRAGECEDVKKYLDENGLEALTAPSHILTEYVHLDKIVEFEDVNDEEEELEVPEIFLRPLQVAVISRQKEVIETIIEYLSQLDTAEEILPALEDCLGQQTRVMFKDQDEDRKPGASYDKDDRSLDGMNCFHLAAKYYPEGLSIIFDVLEKQNIKYSSILSLLLRQDNHLKQTPLHVAMKNSSTGGAR